MTNNEDSRPLAEFEAALRRLSPTQDGLDNGRTMFEAGRAAGQSAFRRSLRIWQGTAAALLFLAVGGTWSGYTRSTIVPNRHSPIAKEDAKNDAPGDRQLVVDQPAQEPDIEERIDERDKQPVVATITTPPLWSFVLEESLKRFKHQPSTDGPEYVVLRGNILSHGINSLPAVTSVGHQSPNTPTLKELLGNYPGGEL